MGFRGSDGESEGLVRVPMKKKEDYGKWNGEGDVGIRVG
jgi:hypothetical protein